MVFKLGVQSSFDRKLGLHSPDLVEVILGPDILSSGLCKPLQRFVVHSVHPLLLLGLFKMGSYKEFVAVSLF